MPHSGLQRDILAFYKLVLRKAQQQTPEVRRAIEDYARSEFRKNVLICNEIVIPRPTQLARVISSRLTICVGKE